MDVTSDDTGRTYKRARTPEERRRIEHEAAVLRQAAHPGIVQLLGTEGADPADVLVLRTVNGGDLTTLAAQPTTVIAGLGAAVATTVADLHALGYSHGSIEASHVLLDEAGRPVLCSFGRSKATARAGDADRLHDDDLRALAAMLLQLLPPDGSGRVARTLRGLATPGRRRPRRDASWLARHLTSAVPDARLPGPDSPGASATPGAAGSAGAAGAHRRRARPPGPLRRITAVPPGKLVGVGCGVLIAGVAVVAARDAASGRPVAHAAGPAAAPCPVADDGCVPIPVPGGVLIGPGGRYQLEQPGDVVVMGRWRCGPTAFPAVLHRRTGDVWTFDSWPAPDNPVVGRLVAHVTSASSLRVRPGPSGCDQLEIDRPDLAPVTIARVAR